MFIAVRRPKPRAMTRTAVRDFRLMVVEGKALAIRFARDSNNMLDCYC